MKRNLARLTSRPTQDLHAVRQHVNITEDSDLSQRHLSPQARRTWHLSAGQMIDLVVNDSELACIAHGLSLGLDIEAACGLILLARP